MGRAETYSGAVVALVVALALSDAVEARSIPPDPGADETPETAFQAAIDVSLLSWAVRVVEIGGSPILGLRPEDLRVRVGKQEIPVVGLDWIAPGGSGEQGEP